jgi:hypothetical protein
MGVNFNGSNQYLAYSDTDLDFTGNFTVMFWHNQDTTPGGSRRIWSNYTIAASKLGGWDVFIDASRILHFQSGKNTGLVAGTDYQELNSLTAITNAIWTHLAFVYNGSNLLIYVNGVLDATAVWANAPAYNGPSRAVGGEITGEFDGSLAELRAWNAVLTADQIKNEMRSLQPVHQIASLKCWVPLDNKVLPATYTDFSQNGITLTPQNTPTVVDTTHF